MTKRDVEAHERKLEQLAIGEQLLHRRLSSIHDEMTLLMRSLDRLVLPRSARRRKSFVDNIVRFPRGNK